MKKYSFIIPVFNRSDEVDELLQSLSGQTVSDFEVLIVEDGSDIPCKEIVEKYSKVMDIKYFTKDNEGPGQARNYGAERSQGQFLIILDSDCVLPPGYLQAVEDELAQHPCEAFGGPDRAHASFSLVQKAINYSMTSFFTTGGIRGGKKQMDKKFYPRSFNMGVQSRLYQRLGGFSPMRFGEDIDFSIRIYKSGANCRLFPEAWVWHKRRTDFRKFFKQVHNSGIARINLYRKYPESLKLVHLLPMLFTLGAAFLLCAFLYGTFLLTQMSDDHMSRSLGFALCELSLLPLLLYSLLLLVDSTLRNRSVWVGLLSIMAAFIQLTGYGTGFLCAWWLCCICGKNKDLQAFKDSFYK